MLQCTIILIFNLIIVVLFLLHDKECSKKASSHRIEYHIIWEIVGLLLLRICNRIEKMIPKEGRGLRFYKGNRILKLYISQ